MTEHKGKCMSSYYLKLITALAVLSTTIAHADERVASQSSAAGEEVAQRPLTPAQVNAIRFVARGVLAAKKVGQEDASDFDQLNRLRSMLDRLIAMDMGPQNPVLLAVQGQESSEQRDMREKNDKLRETIRSDARALAVHLRSHAELKASRASSEDETRSAGMPVGEQRARLFERLSQKLEAALADDAMDQGGQLIALREQLHSTKSLSDLPLTHGTPTLQAMPAGYVPPMDLGKE